MSEDTDKRHSGLSGGELTIDPTENVKALSAAANQRQDDLRQLNDRRIDAEIRVLQVQVGAMEKEMLLRAESAKEIRLLESDRLDKIRQVDVLAGNTAADRALVAIQTLATSQAAAAETLRSMVTTTASTIAAQTSETVAGLTNRIAQLEKSSYEGAGKQAVADPMQAEMLSEFKAMRLSFAEGQGKAVVIDPMIANMMAEQKRTNDILAEKLGSSKGMDKMWGYIIAGILLLIAIAGWMDRVR